MKKTVYYGDGKIVLCDFYRLNIDLFKDAYEGMSRRRLKNGTMLADTTAKIYINSRWKPAKMIAEVLGVLATMTRGQLVDLYDSLHEEYPDIQTAADWCLMQGSTEERAKCLYKVLIPMELDRKKVEMDLMDINSQR